MPTLEQIQADPKFQGLSPEAQRIVMARVSGSPAPAAPTAPTAPPATRTPTAPLASTPSSSASADNAPIAPHVLNTVLGGLGSVLEAERGVRIGAKKGMVSTLAGAGRVVNAATRPFGPGGKVGVGDIIATPGDQDPAGRGTAAFDVAKEEYGTPETGAEQVGFTIEQLAELVGGGGAKAGAGLAARMGAGAAAGGTVRAAQTGGDVGQTALAAAGGGVAPAVAQGTGKAAAAISPHLIARVAGITRSIAEKGSSPTAVRDAAVRIAQGAKIKDTAHFRKLAEGAYKAIEKQANAALAKGAVKGHGFVPRAVQAELNDLSLLVKSLDGKIAAEGVRGLPSMTTLGARMLGLGVMGYVSPHIALTALGMGGVKAALETAPIASRLAQFGARAATRGAGAGAAVPAAAAATPAVQSAAAASAHRVPMTLAEKMAAAGLVVGVPAGAVGASQWIGHAVEREKARAAEKKQARTPEEKKRLAKKHEDEDAAERRRMLR